MNIDFEFYLEEYSGSLIKSEEEFLSYASKAEYYIKEITFGNVEEFDYEVCLAVCAVADVLKNDSGNIVSEHNDGYIVTYKKDKTLLAEVYSAASLYLPDELLYRGI